MDPRKTKAAILADLLALAARVQNEDSLPEEPTPLEQQELGNMRRHLDAMTEALDWFEGGE